MIKKTFQIALLAIQILSTPLYLYSVEGAMLTSLESSPTHIEFTNRILARVNNKPITLYDLVKKMNYTFYKQFPQYKDVLEAKYQFYLINWKSILKDLIDKELILADAAENKFTVSASEVKEEMEHVFGPDIAVSLEQLELSPEEAQKMLKEDMTVRRIMYIRIHPIIQKALTPQAIRRAYEVYAKEHISPEKWRYRVISFRNTDSSKSAEIANLAHYLLTTQGITPDELVDALQERQPLQSTTINVSEELYHTPQEVSELYCHVLNQLDSRQFSEAIAQKSKAAKELVFRIFYMRDRKPSGAPPFKEVETLVKEQIFNEVAATETEAYFQRLRKKFAVEEFVLNDSYQPFTLH